MERKHSVGIVILNYNNYNDTITCIESIEKFNTADIKYIIVDNGSSDQLSVKNLDEFLNSKFEGRYKKIDLRQEETLTLPYATLLVNKTNEGYARGNNLGLTLADKDDEIESIMVLNNDVLFIEDIIPKLLSEMSKLNDCAIISPALFKKDLSDYDYTCARLAPSAWVLIKECLMLGLNCNRYQNIVKEKYWLFIKNPALKQSKLLEIEMPSGSCMLINKKLFKEIGWFDPKTFLYFEENILYVKIHSKGLKNYLMPQLKCIHLGASTTNNVASSFTRRCGLESRTYYLKKYCRLNVTEKIIYVFARFLYLIKLQLLKIIKK